jgi:hypothetical protein
MKVGVEPGEGETLSRTSLRRAPSEKTAHRTSIMRDQREDREKDAHKYVWHRRGRGTLCAQKRNDGCAGGASIKSVCCLLLRTKVGDGAGVSKTGSWKESLTLSTEMTTVQEHSWLWLVPRSLGPR